MRICHAVALVHVGICISVALRRAWRSKGRRTLRGRQRRKAKIGIIASSCSASGRISSPRRRRRHCGCRTCWWLHITGGRVWLKRATVSSVLACRVILTHGTKTSGQRQHILADAAVHLPISSVLSVLRRMLALAHCHLPRRRCLLPGHVAHRRGRRSDGGWRSAGGNALVPAGGERKPFAEGRFQCGGRFAFICLRAPLILAT